MTEVLDAEPYERMKQAIASWWEAKAVMQLLSRQSAFASLPNPIRRKHFSDKGLRTKQARFWPPLHLFFLDSGAGL